MSSRGRGSFRGGRGGRGGSFGGGSFRGEGGDPRNPSSIIPVGIFSHACENDFLVLNCTLSSQVPHFNAFIFLENKSPVGRIDEILGPINHVSLTVKADEGVKPASFKSGDKFFIGSDKVLPLERFLPKPPQPKVKKPKTNNAGVNKPTFGGGFRGGRGGSRGGSFGNRGGSSFRGGNSRGGSRGRGMPPRR